MKTYVVLLRGINVGGKNKVPMRPLKVALEALGFADVSTYIASGNVILKSAKAPRAIAAAIEAELPKRFKLDSSLIKVLVLPREKLRSIVERKPSGFGERPGTYHSDVIFLMGITAARARAVFDPRPGVDVVWTGEGVIYSQRLSAKRTQSRLSKIMSNPMYKQMTIRNWNTTTKLLTLVYR